MGPAALVTAWRLVRPSRFVLTLRLAAPKMPALPA
jgi:hypothetical protein